MDSRKKIHPISQEIIFYNKEFLKFIIKPISIFKGFYLIVAIVFIYYVLINGFKKKIHPISQEIIFYNKEFL